MVAVRAGLPGSLLGLCIYVHAYILHAYNQQSALDMDYMRLVTLKTEEAIRFDPKLFFSIFEPFDKLVWLLTFCMFVVMGMFMWFTEGDRHNADFKHNHRLLCVHVCMHVQIYMFVYVLIYVYIYI